MKLYEKSLVILFFILLFYIPFQLYTLKTIPIKQHTLGITTRKENGKLPIRLIIPSIQVNTAIQYVGLTSTGAMDVPNNIVDVGWFSLGTLPGENGNAVIDGHVDGKDGTAGVFTNLHILKKGDMLFVEEKNGSFVAFIVRGSKEYYPGYANDVFHASDSAHLNLITCDGSWDSAKNSYSKRLVVFADSMQ